MTLVPLPAFSDNYIWLLHDGARALVVDPGDAEPVRRTLHQTGLQLEAILVTHHHADHVGGVAELVAATGAAVYGPAGEDILPALNPPLIRVCQGDAPLVLGRRWQVLDVPGHTAGHIAYFCDDVALEGKSAPVLFCGDTLFSGGCGRLFEGTPAQMLASLDQLAALPAQTQVCCAHEYTLSNLRFAAAVEPDNLVLQHYTQDCERLRAQGQPTLPTLLGRELQINPFLRTRCPGVIQAARGRSPELLMGNNDPVSVFTVIREWKNQFK